MMIFVSDLHLTDDAARTTFDIDRFSAVVSSHVARARAQGIRNITVALIGDIFELLKSQRWLEAGVRPWEAITPLHVDTVRDIFSKVADHNTKFFAFLRELVALDVKLAYIPGNHDRVINTPMGKEARARLLQELSLKSFPDGRFDRQIQDVSHGVIAIHGHEWDLGNRYTGHNAAIGDAVVIEILLRLPAVVAQHTAKSPDDPSLQFLHELDNVSLRDYRTMLRWLWGNLVNPTMDSKTRRQIRDALMDVMHGFQTLSDRSFGSIEIGRWWHKPLTRLASAIVKVTGLPSPDRVPPFPGKPHFYPVQAARDLRSARFADNPSDPSASSYRYVLCGHTHRPEVVALDPGASRTPCYYINTGCWRRIHGWAAVPLRNRASPLSFATLREECLAIIYSWEDQQEGNPPFHFHRVTRG
jgi:UDP-2,3-diacylglucosamine pyrophosphatase LpxH